MNRGGGQPSPLQHRWGDQLSISYMRERIEDEEVTKSRDEPRQDVEKQRSRQSVPAAAAGPEADEVDAEIEVENASDDEDHSEDADSDHGVEEPTAAEAAEERPSPASPAAVDASPASAPEKDDAFPYKILRSLPNYSVGDPLKKEDAMLVYSKEATASAKSRLNVGDCAFILRSDGSFTYAIYEGPNKGDVTSLSFQVDERGHFKVLPSKQFLARVKVPVIPVAMMGSPLVKRYESFLEEKKDGDEVKKVEASASADQLGRTNKAKVPATTSALSRATSVDNIGQLRRRPSTGTLTRRQAQQPKADQLGIGGGDKVFAALTRVATNTGSPAREQAQEVVPSSPAMPRPRDDKPNILKDMLAAKAAGQTPQLSRTDSADILSRMTTVGGLGPGAPNSGSGIGGIRVTSMQDFGRLKTSASPKLRMNAPNGQDQFTLRRPSASGASSDSLDGLNMRSPNNRGSASMGQFSSLLTRNNASGNLPTRNNASGMMPRNVTLRRIDENEMNASGTTGNSGNATWELADSGNSGSLGTMNNNPLLRMAARHANQLTMNYNPMSKAAATAAMKGENPLLEAASNPLPKVSADGDIKSPPQKAANGDEADHAATKKSRYSLGDRISAEQMPKSNAEEMKMALMVSKLQVGDCTWVKRSDGSWGYAAVKSKALHNVVFEVNQNGDTKTMQVINAGKYVRIVDDDDILEAADPNVSSQSCEKVQQPTRKIPASLRRGSDPPERTGSANATFRRRNSAQSNLPRTTSENNMLGAGIMTGGANAAFRRRNSTELNMPRTTSENNTSGVGIMRRQSSTVTVENDGAVMTSSSTMSSSTMSSLPRTESGGAFLRRPSTSGARQPVKGTANAEWEVPNRVTADSVRSEMTEQISNCGKSPGNVSLPKQQTNDDSVVVAQVECKTEDGGTKTVPMYKAGMSVYYRQGGPKNDSVMMSARVLQVHLDDLLEPYYTVQFEDGREKQTDNDHIMLRER